MNEGFNDQPKGEDFEAPKSKETKKIKCDSCSNKEGVKWNHYQYSCPECKAKIVWTME